MTMFLKYKGFFYSSFQHSAKSSSFTILCTIQAIMSNLCQSVNIQKLASYLIIKKYVDKNQIYTLFFENSDFHEILWRLL